MWKWCGVIVLIAFFGTMGNAQTSTHIAKAGVHGSTVGLESFLMNKEIYQDQRITDMLLRHAQINQKRKGTEGYRLEIFFSSETKAREQATRVKRDFNVVFPNIASYMLFQTPNFKVRAGNFRTKSEALKVKELIASKYPNAFIVKDLIQFPDLYTESVEQSEEQ